MTWTAIMETPKEDVVAKIDWMKQQKENENKIVCEKCRAELDVEDKRCPHCAGVPVNPSTTDFCRCGSEMAPDMPECLRCEKVRNDAWGDR